MNGVARGPILVWAILLALLAASWASAFLPLGLYNIAINLAFAAAMVMLLATFLMNMRWSSALLRLVAMAGLFWLALMFALTLSDYLSRNVNQQILHNIKKGMLIERARALVLGAGAASGAWWRWRFGVSGAARAETAASRDLKAAGPLGDEAQGKPDAPVTIIEYASMTCPHCANFDVNVYPLLKSRYIDTGKVRYILREFPLDPLAAAGFMLARCAGNGKFFGLIDVLFRRQSEWMVEKPLAPLLEIAKQAGFTEASFDACLANRDILKGIDQVRERAATELGVEAMPTFFINGKMYRGEMTVEQMEGAIKLALSGGNATS